MMALEKTSRLRKSMRGAAALLISFVGIALVSGCAQQALRGGEGTDNPELDRPAMSVRLDREDINYLVADYLARLETSRFWQDTVRRSGDRPLVAIWRRGPVAIRL